MPLARRGYSNGSIIEVVLEGRREVVEAVEVEAGAGAGVDEAEAEVANMSSKDKRKTVMSVRPL